MTIRDDESVIIDLLNIEDFSTREEVRKFLLSQWILEDSGLKYRYFVETLSDSSRIYLERPGRLNKGCDFVIFAENLIKFQNSNDKPPKHEDILQDLREKKNQLSESDWENLISAINSIYNVESYGTASKFLNTLPVPTGFTYETILKLLRWLFIEQDLTYWAKSGRKMLYNAISEI